MSAPPDPMQPSASAPRYANASAALVELEARYDGWSKRLTDTSLQMSFSLIAANWAVHGSGNILGSLLPRLSIACAFFTILTVLITSKMMVTAHDQQHAYAESNHERWSKEWADARGRTSPWPYTSKIERIGEISRFFRFWLPILGAIFLGLSFV